MKQSILVLLLTLTSASAAERPAQPVVIELFTFRLLYGTSPNVVRIAKDYGRSPIWLARIGANTVSSGANDP
jgi:hypothetical protein